ncbi:hypothetical protein DYD21_12435 [Rhodohalobacter sp. SW132]|nr:hypothetical protein DYD21_12435 [Rhodohalobacter sp. SW132]
MYYLGAKPTRYRLGFHTFLIDTEWSLFWSAPPFAAGILWGKGQWEDELLSFTMEMDTSKIRINGRQDFSKIQLRILRGTFQGSMLKYYN